jgi:multiple sugar transport system substrate-binding protein
MKNLTRRSLLRASLGAAAAGTLARPYIAHAAAKTATVWWEQGYVPQEDVAFRKLVADYQKASGNKIEYSIIPYAPLRQKEIAAITSGVVPDAMWATPNTVTPEQAWDDKLADVSDVIETQKSKYSTSALLAADCYNNVTKRRSYYGIPFETGMIPFHIWGSLVEKAGYKTTDFPKTWTKFLDFFRPMQTKLRAKGMRHIYSYGWEVSTVGGDPYNTFNSFMVAYGGEGIVTKDGKFHSDDPQVREAVIKTLTRLSSDFKEGYVPPGAVNWNDADDNNAFHSQLCVIDFDGTLSTEMAMVKNKQAYYHEVITHGLPLSDEGKPVPALSIVNNLIIPKAAKNVAVAKDFAKYLIEPKVNGEFVKGGLGRWLPVMPSLVQNDPWWTDPKVDPHRPVYVKEGFGGPTLPDFYVYNPAWAQVESEHTLQVAWADVVTHGLSPQQAAAKAFKRIEAIFAKYPIAAA